MLVGLLLHWINQIQNLISTSRSNNCHEEDISSIDLEQMGHRFLCEREYWYVYQNFILLRKDFRSAKGKFHWDYYCCLSIICMKQSICIVCPHLITCAAFTESNRYCQVEQIIRSYNQYDPLKSNYYSPTIIDSIQTNLVTDRTRILCGILNAWVFIAQARCIASSCIIITGEFHNNIRDN